MNKHRCKHGITLTELVVATFVIAIIMIAVVSADYAIRKRNVSAFQNTSSGLVGQILLHHIMTSAFQAVGSTVNPADSGILIGTAGTGDAGTFCIRTVKSPDTWICYSMINANPATLYTCSRAAAGQCVGTDTGYSALGKVDVSVSADVTNANAGVYTLFTANSTLGSQQMVFTVTVRALSPDTTAANVANATSKPLTASISPPMHRI
jgi:Tfp pilus assembly major pilin PilA